jgi:CheY-like chemotaxis protein
MGCRTIVVIEDDDDIRNMLMLMLESLGYCVAGAANGREGLEVLSAAQGPCLILLDLMMPVMNGWEFLQAKREDDVLAVIPVVIVSAFSSQAKDENVEGVLKKPIDVQALLQFVKQYCASTEI